MVQTADERFFCSPEQSHRINRCTVEPPLALFSGLGGKREREPSASEKSICAVPLSRYTERIHPSILSSVSAPRFIIYETLAL